MFLRSRNGGSSVAFAMAKVSRILPSSKRRTQLLPRAAQSARLSSTTSTTSESKSIPEEPAFIADFKKSLAMVQASTEYPVTNVPRKGDQNTFYGFLGRRKDVSAGLSFVPLILTTRQSTSIQLVFRAEDGMSIVEKLRNIRTWSAVRVRGIAGEKLQPKKGVPSKQTVLEISVHDIDCLAEFPEDIRMSSENSFGPDQRHLQLRFNTQLQKTLVFRELVVSQLRAICLDSWDLREVETPILFKSTPEGAREFLVPTRKAGYAYALPQSPQQYKQILMASGFSGYFQFAKCFRDEDQRADRQPEFTQLDLELPYHDGDAIMGRVEVLIHKLYKFLRNHPDSIITRTEPEYPFRVMPYSVAMESYGTDKPDLRVPGRIRRIEHILPEDTAKMLSSISNPCVEAWRFRINGDSQSARSFINEFMESSDGLPFQRNSDGAPGIFIYDPRRPLEGLQSFGYEGAEKLKAMYPGENLGTIKSDLKSLGTDISETPSAVNSIGSSTARNSQAEVYAEDTAAGPLEEGDIIIVQTREPSQIFSSGSTALGRLRNAIYKAAASQHLIDVDERHHFLWVNDFPLFTPDNKVDPGQGGSAGFSATHHPFTAPKREEDVDLLLTDPLLATADHYDLVVNGVELGGGSRRIHNAEMQKFVMRDVLKMNIERLEDFSHLFEALRCGCPPHAGFALGLDRLVAMLAGVESVRDVIVFPKNGKGEDELVKSPRLMTGSQLRTYHLEMASDA